MRGWQGARRKLCNRAQHSSRHALYHVQRALTSKCPCRPARSPASSSVSAVGGEASAWPTGASAGHAARRQCACKLCRCAAVVHAALRRRTAALPANLGGGHGGPGVAAGLHKPQKLWRRLAAAGGQEGGTAQRSTCEQGRTRGPSCADRHSASRHSSLRVLSHAQQRPRHCDRLLPPVQKGRGRLHRRLQALWVADLQAASGSACTQQQRPVV